MMDWNGDGKINLMDCADYIQDTSKEYRGGETGIGFKILILLLIFLAVAIINPTLAGCILIIRLILKISLDV